MIHQKFSFKAIYTIVQQNTPLPPHLPPPPKCQMSITKYIKSMSVSILPAHQITVPAAKCLHLLPTTPRCMVVQFCCNILVDCFKTKLLICHKGRSSFMSGGGRWGGCRCGCGWWLGGLVFNFIAKSY